jgi:hypothetical protein
MSRSVVGERCRRRRVECRWSVLRVRGSPSRLAKWQVLGMARWIASGHVNVVQDSGADGECGEMRVKGIVIDVEIGLQNEGNAG